MAAGAAACDVAPLRGADLFEADAGAAGAGGAPPRDAAAEPDLPADRDAAAERDAAADRDAPGADAAPVVCVPRGTSGLLSGQVTDACTGRPIEAQVGIAGFHTCSFPGKASYHFAGLPTGCRLTLTAAKRGYVPFSRKVVIPEGGDGIDIELVWEGGCAAAPPPETACRCDATICR